MQTQSTAADAAQVQNRTRAARVLANAICSVAVLLGSTLAQADIKQDLQSLYPNLTPTQLTGKIQAATDPFQFLRSFVPYFYDLAKNKQSLTKSLDPVRGSSSGWCAGDPHPENFGTLLNGQGIAIFTINDMDDAGPCPLELDALRFFTAVLLNDKNTDLQPLVKAYRAGLAGETKLSKTTRQLIDDAQAEGSTPSNAALNELYGKSPGKITPLTPAELTEVTNAVQANYGANAIIVSSGKTEKLSGGSYGMIRYEIEFKVDPTAQTKVIEFKQEIRPGIFPVATAVIPATAQRIATTVEVEQGVASNEYKVAKMTIGNMLIRPLLKANHGISLSKLQGAELEDVLEDEAQTLGDIHRQTATASYLKAVQDLKHDAWAEAAENIRKEMKDAYEKASAAP